MTQSFNACTMFVGVCKQIPQALIFWLTFQTLRKNKFCRIQYERTLFASVIKSTANYETRSRKENKSATAQTFKRARVALKWVPMKLLLLCPADHHISLQSLAEQQLFCTLEEILISRQCFQTSVFLLFAETRDDSGQEFCQTKDTHSKTVR